MVTGIIGVGHLGKIMVEALLAAGHAPESLLLSPRGKAADLAQHHGLTLGEDNASVVAQADLVILAVRPKDAVGAITGLLWRAGQKLVSVCAGVLVGQLAAVLPPGVAVHRVMPLTAAAQAASPTTLFPADAEVASLLAAFGPVLPLRSEAEFETATVSAAVYGWVQKLVQLTADWSASQGLPHETARQLAALTTVAAGRNVADSPLSMEVLLSELVTPGGITERGLITLREAGALQAWEQACDAVKAKLAGR